MRNKWSGGLKYTFLGNLKAMETKEGFKPVKEMLHDLWHELDGLRLQTRADKILIDAIGKEMDERQEEVKTLRAELRDMKRKYAWIDEPCTSQVPDDSVANITKVLSDHLHFHRGGFVSARAPGFVGELPLGSVGRAFGTAIIPRELTGEVPPYPKLSDSLKMGDLTVAPDLKKK